MYNICYRVGSSNTTSQEVRSTNTFLQHELPATNKTCFIRSRTCVQLRFVQSFRRQAMSSTPLFGLAEWRREVAAIYRSAKRLMQIAADNEGRPGAGRMHTASAALNYLGRLGCWVGEILQFHFGDAGPFPVLVFVDDQVQEGLGQPYPPFAPGGESLLEREITPTEPDGADGSEDDEL